MPQGVTARAAADLLDLVLDQTFPPGSALPSETELAERLGVSRLTVREAIKSLAGTRVIVVRQGRSSVVNQVDEWSPLEPRLFAARVARGSDSLPAQILEVRRIVEVEALPLAVERCTVAQREVLADALRWMREAHADDDRDTFVEHALGFRAGLIAASGNVYLEALLSPLTDVVAPAAFEAHHDPELRRRVLDVHQEVLAAIDARDEPRARAALAGHFEKQKADPMWLTFRQTMIPTSSTSATTPSTSASSTGTATSSSADAT
ncbi:FadR/GntR family transcriptional regulator [Nocardioides sp. AX2bis]|uniref:FadR/GntR family transcriptional regulator n=1 Tax=Nocardioides sp. AX2bis TaxID=2653157 RepID=UPI0012F4333C|nr:FCD domain-containing protein [Nocardioides sp. AX2bis]VXC39603.1 GntR family transcriptional regulator [Nocardioides sp. AX2bis]